MTNRILLIEDNPSDIELIRTAFEEATVDVDFIIFRDGDEAIAGVQRLATAGTPVPDLAFLDLNLPRASGHEVLAAIRRQPALAAVPVLVFSTSNHPTDRSRCLAAGASDYLVKPPHFDELLALVGMVSKRWLRGASTPPRGTQPHADRPQRGTP